MTQEMIEYYRKRADEYQAVYKKPERQVELSKISDFLTGELKNLSVIEIACGIGYWTAKVSNSAKSVVAIDINKSVVKIAKSVTYPNNNVSFLLADIFNLPMKKKGVSAILGCFILSHIPFQDFDIFLNQTNNLVPKGGKVIFVDNLFIGQPINDKDEFGNLYQTRRLNDGKNYKIIKNYLSEEFFLSKLSGVAKILNYRQLERTWILMYEIL